MGKVTVTADGLTIDFTDLETIEGLTEVVQQAMDEREFWKAHEGLRDIKKFASAGMSNPWALLGWTMARALTTVPYTVLLPPLVHEAEASLNFFCALVGPSGAGKTASGRASARLVAFEGCPQRENIGSGEGIVQAFLMSAPNPAGTGPRVLVRDPSVNAVLLGLDEATALGQLGTRTGSTLVSTLRSAWAGESLGSLNATASLNRRLDADTYRICLVAGVQPALADALLGDAAGGTPQRFIWMPTIDPTVQLPTSSQEHMVKHYKTPVVDFAAEGVFDPENLDQGKYVYVCERAASDVRLLNLYKIQGKESASNPLEGHSMLTRLKAAAGLSLILNHELKITEEIWELSGVLMQVSNRTRDYAAEGSLAEKQRVAIERGDLKGVEQNAAAISAQASHLTTVRNKVLKALASSETGLIDLTSLNQKVLSSRDRKLDRDAGYAPWDLAHNQLVEENLIEDWLKTSTGKLMKAPADFNPYYVHPSVGAKPTRYVKLVPVPSD